ncbi:MAG: ammonia channel protein, partial [Smithella sp.]
AAAGLAWALIEWWHNGTPTVLGVATGAVAGLVAITPACGFVNPMNAMFIGIIVAIVCYIAVAIIKGKLGYDDSLDAFGVHGVGGTVGTIATGFFAEKAVNAAGADGLLFGSAHQLLVQSIMWIAAALFAVVMTFIIYKIVDAVIGMRVEEKNEIVGLDLTQQSEAAYTVIE